MWEKNEGVDEMKELRKRKGEDIEGNEIIRNIWGNKEMKIKELIEERIIGGNVVWGIVEGWMLKIKVREIIGEIKGRVNVKEGGCEDKIVEWEGNKFDGEIGIRKLG